MTHRNCCQIGCLSTEWQSCPAFSPPATIIFLLFLLFEGLLFALFTSIMFGTQVSAIWYDETVSDLSVHLSLKTGDILSQIDVCVTHTLKQKALRL
jgi:hypothetical protein